MPIQYDKIGLIAGGGNLPGEIIKSCIKHGSNIFVIYLNTYPDTHDDIQNIPHAILNIGAVGKALRILRNEGIKHIALAGNIKRPKLSELRPDAGGIKLLARLSAARMKGDNALLVTVIKFFEDSGFAVVGIDQLLADVLMPYGVLGKLSPQKNILPDINLGMEVARTIGNMDIGQAVVVQNGVILGVEAIEGTDALLARCGSLKLEGDGGVLVKMKKPLQDRRIDLPTIGVNTIINANKAGLRGIAIEAGSALVVEREQVISVADDFGMFIVGI